MQRGADIPVTFNNGDQFGALAKANGDVEVYKNGALLGTRSVSAWPYYASGGYIGLWFIDAGDAVLDDFGGGNVSQDSTPTATPTNTPIPPTATQTNTSAPSTATDTPLPPTSTFTNTPVPPTATQTDTPLPPTVTSTATATLTPTSSNTPVNTLTPSSTFTPTRTPTQTFTPTRTNTPTGATALPNCGLVAHGPITKSGNTMFMTITNPTGVSLVMQNVTVTWNSDKGHQFGYDKSLILQQAALGGTVLWTGSTDYPILTVSTNASIPTGTSTLTFTFHQSYDNFDGTEQIYINLATNGCEAYPIIGTLPGPTPTSPPSPTPPPASVFSHADFTYNGDGQRVKSVMMSNLGTTTTYFVGTHYAVETFGESQTITNCWAITWEAPA